MRWFLYAVGGLMLWQLVKAPIGKAPDDCDKALEIFEQKMAASGLKNLRDSEILCIEDLTEAKIVHDPTATGMTTTTWTHTGPAKEAVSVWAQRK